MGERIALVMAGGGGTRLWPASTASRPKQLIDPLMAGPQPSRLRISDGGSPHHHSLLRRTIERLHGAVQPDRIFVVTAKAQVESIRASLPELPPDRIIVEPYGRNTAPCIALSTLVLRHRLGVEADDAILMVLPADHHVVDAEGFRQLLHAASVHAEATRAIVTLGIEPDHPATGFGYIERGVEALPSLPGDGGAPVFEALRFVEKPDLERARAFVTSGRFAWNAGIFVMPLQRIADELARHCPETWTALRPVDDALRELKAAAERIESPRSGFDANAGPALREAAELAYGDALQRAYDSVTPQPIDVAVMEKVDGLRVIPARVGWTDLGSWSAVHRIAPHDQHGNARVHAGPPPVLIDAEGCLVWSEHVRVAVVGLRDVAVIQSTDGVLVCPLDRTQDVREVVRDIDEESR